jgi:hypothetical protein
LANRDDFYPTMLDWKARVISPRSIELEKTGVTRAPPGHSAVAGFSDNASVLYWAGADFRSAPVSFDVAKDGADHGDHTVAFMPKSNWISCNNLNKPMPHATVDPAASGANSSCGIVKPGR